MKTGATLASTHSSGNFPVRIECSKMSVKKGDISLAAFLRSKFGSSSGPGALSAFSSLSNLVIPDCVISLLSMGFVGGPSNLGILVVLSLTNVVRNVPIKNKNPNICGTGG